MGEKLNNAAMIALNYMDSIYDIYDCISFVEFTGTKSDRNITCRVYNDGRVYTTWN